jgi:DNA invertase Pin-like site-specific DNA recombinase
MKTVSYLRVSTEDQDLEKFKASVLDYAARNGFGRPRFIQEKVSGKVSWRKRKLGSVIDSLREGDRLIVPELSRLGRSLIEVLEVLKESKTRGAQVYSVKEGFQLNGDGMQSKIMSTLLALFAEVERDLIVQRTVEGLQNARAKGVRLGRPKGRGRSKLDRFRDEIHAAYFERHERVASLARRYAVSQCAMRTFLAHEKKLQKIG